MNLALCCSAFLALQAHACTVVGITDGDTLTALCDRAPIKVRLAGIDAPERHQPYGTRSRQSLADLCFRQPAELRVTDVDRYGRTVARVTCAGRDASVEQVRRGMAWVYEKYATDNGLYSEQTIAREKHLGLWVDQRPTPPWEWRRKR